MDGSDVLLSDEERRSLSDLEHTLRSLLPPLYQSSYQEIQPVSMGSAGLLVDPDGQVRWDKMWGSFCHLAMAGGPPHKGVLLGPAEETVVSTQPEAYRLVCDEICRGVQMVTGLSARASLEHPGWIRVSCAGEGMAAWLLRAITMENVSVRVEGADIFLPAGPGYRLGKEIKNVITVAAKTCHYWNGHMSLSQRICIADLLDEMSAVTPLIEPPRQSPQQRVDQTVTMRISQATGLRPAARTYFGWLGFECGSVQAAVWVVRMLVASNVLARREAMAVFIPVNSRADQDGARVIDAVRRVHRYANARGYCTNA